MASSSASSIVAATTTVGATRSENGSSRRTGPPARFPYLFKNILDFPRRLFHPPVPSVPKVGSVRSFKLTPCYRVSLGDVLHGHHLPPLGRKEFEDFLYFKEYSVENLYFYFWLEQYEAQWNSWAARQPNAIDANVTPNGQLTMSYARAKQTFFTHGSPWELNLPQRTTQQLLQPQRPHPGPKSHPHPSALASVRFEIETYLNDSLTRFIAQNGGNAGRHRGLFAIVLGILMIGVGLIPIILTSLPNHHHSWHTRLNRLSSLPALWFGFATLICGLHGVCVVIFLFGDARQLYPYELRRPNISSPINCSPGLSLNPNLAANAHERTRLSNSGAEHRSTSSQMVSPSELTSFRRRSEVAVTVTPQRDRNSKTEYVHLPSRKRAGTITTSASGETGMPLDGKESPVVPDLDDGVNQLNFGLYDDGDDETKAGRNYVEQVSSPISGRTPASTTTYSSTAFPDSPIAFNFDALPLPPGMCEPDWMSSHKQSNSGSASHGQDPFARYTEGNTEAVPSAWHNMKAIGSSVNSSSGSAPSTVRRKFAAIKNWEWNKERTVFSPLTKVLDPIITRTQWEIVMRSSLLALALSVVIACGSLGLP